MKIPIRLEMLIDEIISERHTYEEWLELEERANKYIEELPENLQDHFAESGAGELLYMMCSGIRYEREYLAK